MIGKSKRPLTQPEPGDPNYGKSCYQPGSLHTTDLPMQPSLGMQQRTITKGSVVTTRINADINDVINCPKIGKTVKIHDCVLTDCNYEKGHLICTGKSYVHCSFCEGIHPSLKEQVQQSETMDKPAESMDSPATMATGNSGGNVTKIERGAFLDPAGVVTIGSPIQPSFDHKACVLCDHVIVQQVLGNKCKLSGALCCYMRSCPEEDRKKREAAPVAVAKEEIPCCENCPGPCPIWIGSFFADRVKRNPEDTRFTSSVGCLSHPGARAYLNKDVIAELIKRRNNSSDQVDWVYRDCIALLRGDGK